MPNSNPVYKGLRERFLELEPPAAKTSEGEAFALLLEVAASNVTTSVAVTANGDASLYLSTGGGLLGGQGIPEARESARRMVAIGNRLADRTQATDDPAPPQPGEIALFLLTAGGLRVLRAAVSAKFAPDDPLVALIREQGTLITALRAAPAKGFAVPA